MSPVGNFLVLSHRDSSWWALNMAAHLFLLSTLRMYEAVTCLLAWPLIKSKSKILIDIKRRDLFIKTIAHLRQNL